MYSAYEKLIENIKKYDLKCDIELLEKAYALSKEFHKEKFRISGEPFIDHLVEITLILAELRVDEHTLIASILYDTIGKNEYTFEKLEKDFSTDVANIVLGVKNLIKVEFTSTEESKSEIIKKMFLIMSKDVRVILIKLADRLHNMRTLKFLPYEKQVLKSRETLDVFAPLANKLGISNIKWELEDLSFRYLEPKEYFSLINEISNQKNSRVSYINSICDNLRQKISDIGIEAKIDGKPMHLYSIYKKMLSKDITLDEVHDLLSVRVIVKNISECYSVLGLIHEVYNPLPGSFKDYIAMPKGNMYQALHTTLAGPKGRPFEIQINTDRMKKISENGICAHLNCNEEDISEEYLSKKLSWLKQLVEWQKETYDEEEYIEDLKTDFFSKRCFVFTPKGDVVNLSVGACPVDFAYTLNKGLGNKLLGVKVNGKIVNMDYKLSNGDIVELNVSTTIIGPKKEWLNFVKTSKARNIINQWFKKEKREEFILAGKELIKKELEKQNLADIDLFEPKCVFEVLNKYDLVTEDDIYAGVGHGVLLANKIIMNLKNEYIKSKDINELPRNILQLPIQKNSSKVYENSNYGVKIEGVENCITKISKCCNPVPGDDIVGYITKGRGISIHRKDCANVLDDEEKLSRLIRVSWLDDEKSEYIADLKVLAEDRVGLVVEISNVFLKSKINLKALNARTNKKNEAIVNLNFEIHDKNQLELVTKMLEDIEGVISISRH
jgi:guanosine-3',5'-bis(diphosphate) 3'-pyrophosphohydrolase